MNAIQRGYTAFQAGTETHWNSYGRNHPFHEDWIQGWTKAKDEYVNEKSIHTASETPLKKLNQLKINLHHLKFKETE